MPSDPENARRWLDLLRAKNAIKGNAVVPPEEQAVHIRLLDSSSLSNTSLKVWIEGEFIVSCDRFRDEGWRDYRALSDILSVTFVAPYKG